MTNSICGNRAPRRARPSWALIAEGLFISAAALGVAEAIAIFAGGTWPAILLAAIIAGFPLMVFPTASGVFNSRNTTMVVAGAIVLFGAVFVGVFVPAPRFIRPHDRGYELFPLSRPTAALTHAIHHDPRWTGLRAVQGFRVMIRRHTIQGVLHIRGGSYPFSLGKRHPHQVASWIQAFPPHDVPCQFAVEHIDGRYNVYLMPHEQSWFRYSPAFIHGVLVTMTKALAVHRAAQQRQDAHHQRAANRARSWGNDE